MKNEILKIKPPKVYKECLLTIEEGIDNIPEYVEYLRKGYSVEEAKKMVLLVRIEMLKHDIQDSGATEEGLEEIENYIQKLICEYNSI